MDERMARASDRADLPTAHKQARSGETRRRLISAGCQLLERGAFEDTSIAALAMEAECSVGSFYYAFDNKDVFFRALIETFFAEMVVDTKQSITYERFATTPVDDTLTACVTFWVAFCRRHRGLLRSVMKKTLHEAETWTPVRRYGQMAFDHCIAVIAAQCGKSDSRQFQYRARVGFQILMSTIMNTTLHQTMRLNLEGDELIDWMTEILRHCLFDELPAKLLVSETPMLSADGTISR
jgi:AcrR family transcriptional regulator